MKRKFVVTPPYYALKVNLYHNINALWLDEVTFLQRRSRFSTVVTKEMMIPNSPTKADSPTKLFLKLSLSLSHLNKVKPKPLKMILNLQKYLSN
ncbi:unnamed protein product [Brassica oleracea var. botrytis]